MYIRKVKTINKKNAVEYFTYRLVKNVRHQGVPKQINLISLGKLEDVTKEELNILAKRIDEIYNHQSILYSDDLPQHIENYAHFFTEKLIQKDFVNTEEKVSDYQENPEIKEFVEIDIQSINGQTSEQIGGEFLCNQTISELELGTFLKEELKYTDNQLDNSIIALIGRLLYSSNENQTARWLNDNSAIQEFYPLLVILI